MKNFLQTIRFQSKRIISGEYENSILRELNQLEGIEGLHMGLNFVEVDYYPQVQSPETLRETLRGVSFDFKEDIPAKRSSGLLRGFISNLAKENRKTFGKKGPSCCG